MALRRLSARAQGPEAVEWPQANKGTIEEKTNITNIMIIVCLIVFNNVFIVYYPYHLYHDNVFIMFNNKYKNE